MSPAQLKPYLRTEREDWLSGMDTAETWRALSVQLDAATGDGPWMAAFAFLKRRLETRYLEPIRVMQLHLNRQGEGFAIVSLQCALLEFFAALVEGKHFVPGKTDPSWDEYAYKDSGALFVRFLCREEPFCAWLETNAQAQDFYRNVRCGLVHEAMTKKQWLISVSGGRGFDTNRRIVYRDTLQQAIDEWLAAYERRLTADQNLREALIRKLNHVAA